MTMAKRVWDSISSTTIKNCWNHTDIQQPQLPIITLRPPHPPMPANLAAGWDMVVQFATNSWSLPEVHSSLQEHLGDQYIASKWNEPLDSVSGAEGDAEAALAAVNAWCNQWVSDSASDLCEVTTIPDEHNEVKEELLDLVAQLKVWRRIIGKPFTLEELLDPAEEWEIGQCLNVVDSGDMEIVSMVQVKARGNVEEINSDSDEDNPKVVPPSLKEMLAACQMLEENGLLVCTDVLNIVEAVC